MRGSKRLEPGACYLDISRHFPGDLPDLRASSEGENRDQFRENEPMQQVCSSYFPASQLTSVPTRMSQTLIS